MSAVSEDVIKALEDRVNGDVLLGVHELYNRVEALAVPIEASIASHLRTLLGEAAQAVTAMETHPATLQAEAQAEAADTAPVTADAPSAGATPDAQAAVQTPASAGAPAGVTATETAPVAPGGGPGQVLDEETAERLSDLADSYEAERERILSGGAQKPAEAAQSEQAPSPAPPLGGSPQGAV